MDACTRKIMDEVTRMLGEMRGETPPAEPFDPDAARAAQDATPGSAVAQAERPAS